MPIRLIAADLDGTLLRDDKTVSERTKTALAACRERGVKVIFATGRAYRTKVVPPEWFDGWVIANGANVFIGETLIYERRIPCQDAQSILEACKGRGIQAELRQEVGEIYVPDMKPGDAEFIRSILPGGLYLIVLRDSFGQIMHKEATKSKGAAALAAHWGIRREEVAAFGDDLNDIDLLQWAGYGIAMGNAREEVNATADSVTLSNQEDGLAVWIEENVL
jgi:hypothetical protein